jgi:septum site-determining protein MinD
MSSVIGMVSGKGGVGKTTMTANIGVALAGELSIDTVVLDCNVLTSNLGLHLGLIHVPITLHDILVNKLSLSKATYVHNSGLYVIPSSLSLGTDLELENLKKIINDELTERYKMVFLDSAPGLSQEALAVIHAVDEVYVVTNPELPAVTDALKTIDVAEKFQKKIRGVILNKVTRSPYELTEEEIESTLGYRVLANIPFDKRVPQSIAMRTPVVQAFPNSPASVAIRDLAAFMGGRSTREKKVVVPAGLIERIKYVIFGRV